LSGVSFVDGEDGTAVGSNLIGPVILPTSDGGQSWTMLPVPSLGLAMAVAFVDRDHGIDS